MRTPFKELLWANIFRKEKKKMDILKLAQRYNEFQNDVGQFLISDMDETISALFSPSFKKIANGSVLVAKREELKDQLTSVLEQAGKWLIDVKETLVFQNSQKCLIH
jgi:hypothetical protein